MNIKKKHPSLVKLITSENNVGIIPNLIRTILACQGKYIAICEGDDYWTDPHKLQKQVDFLENNKDYAFVHTDYNYLNEHSNETVKDYQKSNGINNRSGFCFDYTFNHTHIRTLTVCFRTKHLLECIPILEKSIDNNWVGADLQIYLYLSYKYKIQYMPISTGTYRRLQESASSSNDLSRKLAFYKSHFEIRTYIIRLFELNETNYIRVLNRLLNSILKYAFHLHNIETFNNFYKLYLNCGKPNKIKYRIMFLTINNWCYFLILYYYKIRYKLIKK